MGPTAVTCCAVFALLLTGPAAPTAGPAGPAGPSAAGRAAHEATAREASAREAAAPTSGAGPSTDRAASAVRAAPAPVAYTAPVAGPLLVLRPFQPPPTPYAAGHRGVDLSAAPGAPVLAAAAGRVRFAGSVAGRGVVVIAHADGVSTEYEPVTPLVRAGAAVARAQPIGFQRGTHAACSPRQCLHWGARRDGHYFDPLQLLQPLGPVRLMPWP